MNVGNAKALCAVTTEASVLLSQSTNFTFLLLSVFQNENWKASITFVHIGLILLRSTLQLLVSLTLIGPF